MIVKKCCKMKIYKVYCNDFERKLFIGKKDLLTPIRENAKSYTAEQALKVIKNAAFLFNTQFYIDF